MAGNKTVYIWMDRWTDGWMDGQIAGETGGDGHNLIWPFFEQAYKNCIRTMVVFPKKLNVLASYDNNCI